MPKGRKRKILLGCACKALGIEGDHWIDDESKILKENRRIIEETDFTAREDYPRVTKQLRDAVIQETARLTGTTPFGNPHDVFKIDYPHLLPQEMREFGLCYVNMGKATRRLIRGLRLLYVDMNVPQKAERIDVEPTPMEELLFNGTIRSEASVLSFGLNHGVFDEFLEKKDSDEPFNIILPGRHHWSPKSPTGKPDFHLRGDKLDFRIHLEGNLQLETDLILESPQKKEVILVEAKLGDRRYSVEENRVHINVQQLYVPFRFFRDCFASGDMQTHEGTRVRSLYVIVRRLKKQAFDFTVYEFGFPEPENLTSCTPSGENPPARFLTVKSSSSR